MNCLTAMIGVNVNQVRLTLTYSFFFSLLRFYMWKRFKNKRLNDALWSKAPWKPQSCDVIPPSRRVRHQRAAVRDRRGRRLVQPLLGRVLQPGHWQVEPHPHQHEQRTQLRRSITLFSFCLSALDMFMSLQNTSSSDFLNSCLYCTGQFNKNRNLWI